jgi:hypothetical protein
MLGTSSEYGYRRLTVMLKGEGLNTNVKRIYRLCIEDKVIARTATHIQRIHRQPVSSAVHINEKWNMNFGANSWLTIVGSACRRLLIGTCGNVYVCKRGHALNDASFLDIPSLGIRDNVT